MGLFLLNRAIRIVSESGLVRKKRLPRPVVSFGNISFGGSGKTPHVIYLVRRLADDGLKVAVLSRGYARKSKEEVIVTPSEEGISPEHVGDEPCLISRRIPSVTLGIGPDRTSVARKVLDRVDVDLFVLDDGFQQFFLEKDFDVLLVNRSDLVGMRNLRRRFGLREDIGSVNSADFLIITKWLEGDLSGAEDMIMSLGYGGEWAVTTYVPGCIVGNDGSKREPKSGEEVFLFGGIADFFYFRKIAEKAGFEVRGELPLPDHVVYSESLMEEVSGRAGGATLLTTEKDLVKLPLSKFGKVEALRIDVEFLRGEEVFWDSMARAVGGEVG